MTSSPAVSPEERPSTGEAWTLVIRLAAQTVDRDPSEQAALEQTAALLDRVNVLSGCPSDLVGEVAPAVGVDR